jgi:hypothetical protein
VAPRPQATPTALALHLLSDVPFALLLPIDIATQARASKNLCPDIPIAAAKTAFVAAGKLTMLATELKTSPFETVSASTSMLDGIENVAVRNGLRICAPPDSLPKTIVPPSMQEALARYQRLKMFHLGAAKAAATLRLACFWPKLASTVKTILNNCPGCELEKARQNEATGAFAARPHDAPRSRHAMDFQGQGLALTGETQ